MSGKTIKKGPSLLDLGTAFLLGSLSGLLGLHLLVREGSAGPWTVSLRKLSGHLSGLFLAGFGIMFLAESVPWAGEVFRAKGYPVLLILLGIPAAVLLLRTLLPDLLERLLPIRLPFLCPQCYQRQHFRFQPVSAQFGFWVTYLCPYCSCLVDAWGDQIFYPSSVSTAGVLAQAWRTSVPSLAALLVGGGLCGLFFRFF